MAKYCQSSRLGAVEQESQRSCHCPVLLTGHRCRYSRGSVIETPLSDLSFGHIAYRPGPHPIFSLWRPWVRKGPSHRGLGRVRAPSVRQPPFDCRQPLLGPGFAGSCVTWAASLCSRRRILRRCDRCIDEPTPGIATNVGRRRFAVCENPANAVSNCWKNTFASVPRRPCLGVGWSSSRASGCSTLSTSCLAGGRHPTLYVPPRGPSCSRITEPYVGTTRGADAIVFAGAIGAASGRYDDESDSTDTPRRAAISLTGDVHTRL